MIRPQKKIARDPPLGDMSCADGLLLFPLRRGAQPWLVSIRPGDPKFARVSPPGINACPRQAPTRGRPTIVGGFSAAASAGKNPPLSLQTEFLPIPANDPHIPAPLRASVFASRSSLFPGPGSKPPQPPFPNIPVSGAGSAAASTPSPVPCHPSPPLSSTPDPDIPCSTERSGGGRRRQPVVNPVEEMEGVVYLPETPRVEEGDLI